MKKKCLLFLFLLYSTITFAQLPETKVLITGLGEFSLGMSPLEMEDVLKVCKSSDTKIAGIFDGESSLSITNLKLLGYTFDQSFFTFIDNELRRISLTMYFDKKNTNPKEFDDLLSILERDYGTVRKAGDKNSTVYLWRNEDKKMLMYTKDLEKKRTRVSIMATVDIMDRRNMEVYK